MGRVGINSLDNRDLWFAVLPNAIISANPVFFKQAVCERNSQLLAGAVSLAVLLWEQRLTLCLDGAHGTLSAKECEGNKVSPGVGTAADKSSSACKGNLCI